MLRSLLFSFALAITVLAANQPQAAEPGMNLRLVNNPALSPDGQWLAFDWNGDIWLGPIAGGNIKQLTTHPGRDRDPKFSPDGKTIAFISDREAGNQVFTIPVEGGTPKQITFNTAGYNLLGWAADGKHVLTSGLRDHYWTGRGAERFFLINTEKREAEVALFDDYGSNASLSPDGKKILFTREGHQWWRKGYHGTQASQIWMYDLESKKFTPVIMGEWDARWPLWKADSQGFYFVGVPDGKAGVGAAPNLWEMSADGKKTQLTKFEQDAVTFPAISKNGKTIVFRHLFDLYSYAPGSDKTPQKITFTYNGDRPIEKIQRRSLTTASSVAFSNDGLEVAFIAGGDLWVMDTELREPVQITKSPDEEHSPVFSPDNERILLVSDQGGQSDIWQVERGDKTKYWFQNTSFKMTKLTNDAETESNIKFSPDGTKIAYTKGRGDIVISDADGKNPKTFVKGFNPPQYEWSPDSKWMVYATEDNDFNSDVFIAPLDGSREPYNLSRHPFEDRNPTWSPDGKIIAFTSRRNLDETDIYYVYLTKDPDETGTRERSLEKALEKMNRGRRSSTFTPPVGGTPGKTDPTKEPSKEPAKDPAKDPAKPQTDPARKQGNDDQDQPPRGRRPGGGGGPPGAGADPTAGATQGAGPAVVDDSPIRPLRITKVEIDFDGLADRLHRISIPNSNESNLFWSPDGKKLAFSANIGGTTGIHTVEFPDSLTPKSLNLPSVSQPRWIRNSQIVGSIGGVPSSIAVGMTGATPTSFRFTALQKVDLPAKHAAAFDLAWRTMRDNFYDGKLGNNDWNAIRTKYLGMAGEAIDPETLGTVVSMMLGELNGSHLGFTVGRLTPPTPGAQPGDPSEGTGTWREQTMHLGVRFDLSFAGPGLKIRDVLPKGPASLKKSKLEAGEIVLAINDTPVDPKLDLSTLLTLPPNTDVTLKVKNAKGEEREVKIRPIAIATARTLLYDKWLDDNRAMVDKASGGKLGYLHISGMSMPTFWKFQEELFSAGNGKDGLIIDVRENGGGSTADHLLTALTQPVHALTIPRGGTQVGYPIDRKVYASWNKPILVMCNQNSFSNAEIFSHAIKTLKRGHIVGVTTAGGVISTGGTSIMDVGFLRLPFRGWYLVNDGQDMELNGCVPDVELWPAPGEMPQGKDAQLMKAVEVLSKDVADWKAQPRPKLTKATDRK